MSNYPISIIIIGIGTAGFGKMENLDSDDDLLKDSHGRRAKRDIVQFVAFRKFSGDAQKLAYHVLKELPQQVVGFYKSINCPPATKIQANMAVNSNMEYTRTGTLKDKDWYEKNPQNAVTNNFMQGYNNMQYNYPMPPPPR